LILDAPLTSFLKDKKLKRCHKAEGIKGVPHQNVTDPQHCFKYSGTVPDGSCLHLPDKFLVRHHHWRLLDNLLMAPLDGAITATKKYILNI
jgi:hypothetical protein